MKTVLSRDISMVAVRARSYALNSKESIKKYMLLVLALALPGEYLSGAAKASQPLLASTKYIVRTDMRSQAGHKSFNDLILEITKSIAAESLPADIRKLLNTRLAIMYLINDRAVDCLTEQVVEQLAKTATVSVAEKQKIKDELTQISPQNPLYLEEKFLRNRKATSEDYNNFTKMGLNLNALQEIITKLVPCDFFKNSIESRWSTWLTGGAQFYVRESVQTYLNRYLLLAEEALRHIFSDDSLDTKKRNIASLIEKVRSMHIGNNELEKKMWDAYTSVINSELKKQAEKESDGVAPVSEETDFAADQVALVSLSLRTLAGIT